IPMSSGEPSRALRPSEEEALARDYGAWLGGRRVREEIVRPWPARALAATLDRDPGDLVEGAWLPWGWHWLHFHHAVRASELGRDGHEALGRFLPDVPLERRMWAGGRIRFHAPLVLGEPARRVSTVHQIMPKRGRTGALVFVTVKHEIHGPDGLAVEEEQDIVYRSPPEREGGSEGEDGAKSAPGWPEGTRPADTRVVGRFRADAVTLFRFSALTFNAHRIHYDHPYATAEEGYPGLVVHGPLLALLLLDAGAVLRSGDVRSFEYRARAPLFCDEDFELLAAPSDVSSDQEVQLWAAHPERGPAMEANLR
ncbi:MAG: MaoC family dehydratase N-terminal domain-containing protein, partial [Gemmatimonadota bacterium]